MSNFAIEVAKSGLSNYSTKVGKKFIKFAQAIDKYQLVCEERNAKKVSNSYDKLDTSWKSLQPILETFSIKEYLQKFNIRPIRLEKYLQKTLQLVDDFTKRFCLKLSVLILDLTLTASYFKSDLSAGKETSWFDDSRYKDMKEKVEDIRKELNKTLDIQICYEGSWRPSDDSTIAENSILGFRESLCRVVDETLKHIEKILMELSGWADEIEKSHQSEEDMSDTEEYHIFNNEKPSPEDVTQLGETCYLAATLFDLAQHDPKSIIKCFPQFPDSIENSRYIKTKLYGVAISRESRRCGITCAPLKPIIITVDRNKIDKSLAPKTHALWPLILEYAFATNRSKLVMRTDMTDYSFKSLGSYNDALDVLSEGGSILLTRVVIAGKASKDMIVGVRRKVAERLSKKFGKGKKHGTCSFIKEADGQKIIDALNKEEITLYTNHAYAIVDVNDEDKRITLFEPNRVAGRKNGNGIFDITFDDFNKYVDAVIVSTKTSKQKSIEEAFEEDVKEKGKKSFEEFIDPADLEQEPEFKKFLKLKKQDFLKAFEKFFAKHEFPKREKEKAEKIATDKVYKPAKKSALERASKVYDEEVGDIDSFSESEKAGVKKRALKTAIRKAFKTFDEQLKKLFKELKINDGELKDETEMEDEDTTKKARKRTRDEFDESQTDDEDDGEDVVKKRRIIAVRPRAPVPWDEKQ